MREILFRGKRIDNREWTEGSLLKVSLNGKTAHLIFGDDFIFINKDVKALNHALVDPATVGQYTGLTDKNGKKIFEGDILKIIYLCQKPVIAVAEFTDAKFTARYTRNGKEHIDNLTATASSLYEIIGNIHDNSELVKGGAE